MIVKAWIILLALLAGLLFGIGHVWHHSFASQIVPIRTGDDPAIVAFRNAVEIAHETKGAEYMESWARDLRLDESRTAGGTTRLFEFYNVLADINCQCRDGTRKVHSFDDRKARLDAWLQKYPNSITATLALAILWEYRSWEVVGGYANANPLTVVQKQEFQHSRTLAAEMIRRLKITDDPYVAFFAMRIAEYSAATEGDVARLYEESVAAWPRHYQIYFLYANSLPWMYDDWPAEIHFMQDLSTAKDDPNKQVGLSFVIGSMFRGFVMSPSSVTWPEVKDAYDVRRRLYGWRNRDLNTYCYLAIAAQDWPTANTCMREVDGHWDDVVWESQK